VIATEICQRSQHSSATSTKANGITSEIDRMNTEEARRLAHLYERKLATLAALTQSPLHHAFTGQL